MLKILLAIFVTVILSTSVSSADNLNNVDNNTQESFCDYANGAMTVYSKFKQPSKEQSEKFFSYVKTKWQNAQCSADCSDQGIKAGKEYAYLMNVPMDN